MSTLKRLGLLVYSCTALGLLALVGCTSKTVDDKNGGAPPPILNMPSGNTADPTVAPANSLAQSDNGTPTERPEAPAPTAAMDADTKSLIADLEANFQAWHDKKPFDFKPAAARLIKRLETNFDVTQFQLAADTAQMCQLTGSYETAKQIYAAIQKAATKSENPQLMSVVKDAIEPELTKLNLLGTKPKIDGVVFGGEKLDWDKYRGKVVLLDFWATWCGPCRQELPNVVKTYDMYHDQGFAVVGISLDDSKDKLADFLAKEKLPWTILFNEDPAKQGWEGAAMTKEFAINSIPATFLVDRAGKIVSLSARGEELESQVKKLLSEKE